MELASLISMERGVTTRAELAASHEREVRDGERFKFGENWMSFVERVDDERVDEAVAALQRLLKCERLDGKTFLDIGSGSGLSSLAARLLGARVTSFDYDAQSVESTTRLRERYFKDDTDWEVGHGSVLDPTFMAALGKFDIVYSWGVLHHTGAMWDALRNTTLPVAEGGTLTIAINNDQGVQSDLWKRVKKLYCSGIPGRAACTAVFYPIFFGVTVAAGVRDHFNPLAGFQQYKKRRGMSVVHDWRDWLGGYPFEVATADALVAFLAPRGFTYQHGFMTKRLGCNELIFTRNPDPAVP